MTRTTHSITTAAHAAQEQSLRDPPGTTPSRGPEQVRRGASSAPLPRQGPGAGTMSPVLGPPPRAPRGCPVKPGARTSGVREGTTATGKPTGARRATRPDEARRTRAGPPGTPESPAAGHDHGTGPGAKQQRPPGPANPDSAHHTHTTTARVAVPSNTQPGIGRQRRHTPAARGHEEPEEKQRGEDLS